MSNIFDMLPRGVYAVNMNDLAWIGATVLQRRGELGLSQGALAQMAGLSRATVNALERGTVVDLSVGRLGRLLQVLGARLQLAPRAAHKGAAADRSALQTAAQSASVSYRSAMPATALAAALASGDIPPAYLAHISTLIDEAPLPVVVAAVEAAARQGRVPPAQVWKHLGTWARELKSPRKEWHGL
jgi:transcriptional regulator with XRE-family HTH domain